MTESSLFTIFVVAYLFYLGKSLNPPYPREVLEFPWLGSFFLFGSSATVVVAEHRLKKGNLGGFHLWWLITILMGFGFLIYTGAEWYHLIYHDGLTLSTNLFGSTFYSLVGLHASHVVVGLVLLTIILVASLTGNIQPRHHEHIQMISWYWHFVDGIWAVVVTVVYIIGMQS
jgi:cytochrome c oxidase subunit 3/cytochrome o ubiquinol oxidase subunit 3